MKEINIQICKNRFLKKGTDIVASTQMLQIIKALDQKLKGMENIYIKYYLILKTTYFFEAHILIEKKRPQGQELHHQFILSPCDLCINKNIQNFTIQNLAQRYSAGQMLLIYL